MSNKDHRQQKKTAKKLKREKIKMESDRRNRQQKKMAKKLKREKIKMESDRINRQQKKMAKKLKREKIKMESDRRRKRNSLAARVHQITSRPGRGGLSALGAEQLRKYFSTASSQDEKLSIDSMDPTASMTVLQMAAEEIDAAGMTYEELRKVAEERIMAYEGGEREAAVSAANGEVEEVAQGEQAKEAEGDVESEDEATEEIDAAEITCGELRKAAEETIMACEGGEREAAVNGGNRELEEVAQVEQDMGAEGDLELEDEEMGEEDWEEGGVALAKDY